MKRSVLILITLLGTLCANATTALTPTPTSGVAAGPSQYYRLFTPLTFYHSVAADRLALDGSTSADDDVDLALLRIYLNRPDLVRYSEREMQESGELRQDVIETTISQQVKLVDDTPAAIIEDTAEPIVVVIEKPNFWKYKGDGYLQFMQNYISENWYKGGESNYAALASLVLEANYDNKQKWKWDNKLEMKLGFRTAQSDTVHKFKTSDDLFRYTGKVGLQAASKWYYTLQLQAQTQFARGFKSNNAKTFSDIMSPFDFNIGLGMDYKVSWLKKRLTGTVNLSPLAVSYRYVDRTGLAADFGVKTDRHTHSFTDFGSQLTASLEWKMNDNVTWKTRIYGFTSYHRATMEWENTFALRVSKYITANLFVFPRFDDATKRNDDLGYFQFKEYSSLGFAYNF